MKKTFLLVWDWLRQPNHVTGLLLLACGGGGLWSELIPPDLASGLIGASLPYLIHNPTVIRILQASIIPAIAAISRRPNSR
ncbi:hypothetical protein [Aristophania vespae]|uniref:hypothetical protein n=1 Tax=Aristophania vespae TaxID=2697033 RepID=UPI0023518E77|nr:hypothetical protein [Aristophania vespae]UMM63088.1 hypothetical protein DM15PD_00420 [Aristophania vespae]